MYIHMLRPDEVKFTRHALERLELRTISRDMVIEAVTNPDRTINESDGDTKFIRELNGRMLHVVCKPLVEERKWLVKSAWIRGEDDQGNKVVYRPRQQASSPWDLAMAWAMIVMALIALVIFILMLVAPQILPIQLQGLLQ
jgi:hypothetical protein